MPDIFDQVAPEKKARPATAGDVFDQADQAPDPAAQSRSMAAMDRAARAPVSPFDHSTGEPMVTAPQAFGKPVATAAPAPVQAPRQTGASISPVYEPDYQVPDPMGGGSFTIPNVSKIRRSIANTAVGHSLEGTMPAVADALHLRPSETVYSPEYEQHKDQIFAPEELVDPENHMAHGFATAAGRVPNAPNMAIAAGTMGVGELIGPMGAAVRAIFPRLVSAGFSAQMLKGLYQKYEPFKEAVDRGDEATARELAGQAFVEGPMAATTAFHAATGGGAVKTAREAVFPGTEAHEQTGVNEAPVEPKVQSQQEITRDEQGDIFDQVAPDKSGTTVVAGQRVPKVIAGFDKAGRMAGEPGFEGDTTHNPTANDVAKPEAPAPAPPAADTRKANTDPFTGQYTPERTAQVHKPAIEAAVDGKVPSGQQPTITVMGGGTASGKTTAVRQIMGDNPNLVNIDADANKLRIPEYEGFKQTDPANAAWNVHEESSDLAKAQLAEAVRRKLDIVLDATTTGNAAPELVSELKKAGYKVDLKFVDVPVDIAKQRADTRARESKDPTNRGRFIPPHVIEENHGKVAGAFASIKDMADSAELYDNTGKAPELVYQRLGKEPETVYNQDRYEAFKRKGQGQAQAAAAAAGPGLVRDQGGRGPVQADGRERDAGQPGTGAAGQSRAVAGEIVRVPLGDITTKEKDFQPRERLNAERVSSIASNMRRAREFGDREPIDLWKDPATGKLIVLSGHHRLAAAKEAGMSDATARIHADMTRAEAQDFARQSNAKAAPLTAMEQARAFEAENKAGKSAQDIGQAYGGLTSTQVEDTRRLTKLAPELQRYVQDGMFDQKRAEVLAKATERYSIPPEVQKQAFDYVIKRREITPAQFGKLLDTFAPAAVKQIGFDFGNQSGFEGMGGFKGLADVMDEYNDAITKLNASRRRLKGFMNEVQRQEREGQMVSPAKRAAVREIQGEVNELQKQVEGMEDKAGKGEVFKTLGSEIRKAQEAEPQVKAPDEGPEMLSPRAVKLDEPEVETTSPRADIGEEPEVHHPQTTMFSGTAVMDPAAWRAVFPSATDWMRDKVGDRDMTAGELERGIVRQRRGELDRSKAVIFKALESARKTWDKASKDQSVEFADAIERGDLSKLSPEHKAMAEQLAGMLKQRRLDIQALGTGALDSYIENYFPHNWEKPGKAKQVFQQMMGAKRPLKGPASFLKQRTIPTIKEGLEKGLTPVTYNPVEATLLKAYEMDRFLMAHQIMADMKSNDLAKFVKLGDRAPDDWAKVNDSMFRVLQHVMTVDEKTGKQSPAFAIRGEYWAPKEAATVLNNFLSPGLRGDWRYDAFKGASNVLNQAQLGFSAFHLGFTSIDAATSDMALAIEHASRGSIGKAALPAARAISFVGSNVNTVRHGNKMMAEYLSPGTYPEYARLAQAVEAAGGRATMDPTYRNEAVQKFRTAMKEKSYGKAMARAVPAALELAAKPIMEWTVPRQKLGVFHNLAADILERSDKGRWAPEKTRAELQKAWDSVDNRMGQVVYDNLFWNKAAKDLAMVSVRSVGWNFGSGREIGGGVKDFAAQGMRAAIGERPEVTHRMAYIMALPIIAGFYGALYQKIATGKGPEEMKDYFFPKTGRLTPQGLPERVSLPTYMKDYYAVKQDPAQTVVNKLHPAIAATAQFLKNEDYYGTEIRHEGDPATTQVKDSLIFVAKQLMPFSYRNALQRRKTGATLAQTAQSFVGITPAPGYIVRSSAQELTHERYLDTLPKGGRTKEQAEQSNTRHDLTAELRAGTMKAADIWAKVRSKEITPADAGAIQRAAKTDSFVHEFGAIPLPAALEAWDKMTPDERTKMRPQLAKKASQLEKYLPEQREQLQAKLRKALSAGKATAEPTVKAGLF